MRNVGLWPVLGPDSQQMAVKSNHPLKNHKAKTKISPAACCVLYSDQTVVNSIFLILLVNALKPGHG